MSSLGPCFCFGLLAGAREEEEQLAKMLLDFLRSPEGAEGMALLASRAPGMPRRFYLFPGSEPRVQEAVAAVVRQYGGVACEPPAADGTIFLLGSTEVWRRLPPTKRAKRRRGSNPRG